MAGSSLSSSGVSSCYSEMDSDRYNANGEESDEEDAFISFTTTESKCERLYEQGLEFKCEGDLHESLSSFLKCLGGMQECQYFAKLPQTLNQLSDLYRSLQHLERAEHYSKAEKLFYETIITEPRVQASREGGARQKTKRRVFGKNRPASSSSAMCNPAEYGNLLNKKAEGFERLARVCATECKFDLAQEYSSKAASIRQTILGQRRRAVSDYTMCSTSGPVPSPVGGVSNIIHTFRNLSEAEHLGKNDSKAGHIGTICENEANGTDESALYGGVQVSPTTGSSPQYTPNVTLQPSSALSENIYNHKGNPAITPYEGSIARGCETTTAVSELYSYGSTLQEGCKYHMPIVHECAHANIQRHPRQEDMNDIHKDTKEDKAQSPEFHSGRVEGIGSQLSHESNLCAGVANNSRILSELKNPMSKLSELKNPMCKLSALRKPMSKLSELRKPMSKLSELKNPMCVNLDLHKSPGEGVEPTRCLPMWILLLPAFLALVGYVMYYH